MTYSILRWFVVRYILGKFYKDLKWGIFTFMYRVLLVDDEILVRDAIKENIDWKGLDCELVGDCENGQQAAEFVKTHPVDIVLTDILMPYMDGMMLGSEHSVFCV